MRAFVRKIIAPILACAALALAPGAGAADLTTWLEARLGAERLVLQSRPKIVLAAYTPPGVAIFNHMLYRTTPVLALGGTQVNTVLSGSTIPITTTVTIPITAVSCTGIASGQQLIDATTGTLVGTVNACNVGSPYTLTLSANNLVVVTAGDSLTAQNTLPDACQGTIAVRIRGNLTPGNAPYMGDSNFFINGNGQGGGAGEAANGLWMQLDPLLRFNWQNPTNQISHVGESSLDPAVAPVAQDKWSHIVVTWNTCVTPNYSVAYIAPEGGSWTRLQYNSNATAYAIYNANTSSPYQDNTYSHHNAFSFGSDLFSGTPGYHFEGDTEDAILDIGTSQGAVGVSGSGSTFPGCVAYSGDSNPCIPLAVLNGYYNASTGKPVRINSTGVCSDWFGHQPTMCLTTDGGGVYAPSSVNFSVNRGYGGSLAFSTYGATGTVIGPATLPVTGTVGPYQKWIVQNSGTGTGTVYPISGLAGHTYAAGDFMMAALTLASGPGTVACGTGWTTIWSGTNSSQNASAICWRIATGNASDTTAVITLSDTTTKWRSTIANYQGVDPVSPIDTSAVVNANIASASQTLPAITTTHINDLYVGYLFDQYTSSWSYVAPTNLGVRANPGGPGNPQFLQVDHAAPSIGAIAASTVTVGVSLKYQGISIALKAAGSP